MDQGPAWWVVGSGLRPQQIAELEEVQALTLTFQGGVRTPALQPPNRGLRMRLGQQGLPEWVPSLGFPCSPSLDCGGARGLPRFARVPSTDGGSGFTRFCTLHPTSGNREAAHSQLQTKRSESALPCANYPENTGSAATGETEGEEGAAGLSFQTEMPRCGRLNLSHICVFVPMTHETMWGQRGRL